MNRIVHHKLYKGIISIGLQKGYSVELYSAEELITYVKQLQENLALEKGIYLGANCYHSELVLVGQREPHLNFVFIDYPKFPLEEETFKVAVEWIAERLMKYFHQNRLVIQFHDSTIMLEESPAIDPRIKSNRDPNSQTQSAEHNQSTSTPKGEKTLFQELMESYSERGLGEGYVMPFQLPNSRKK